MYMQASLGTRCYEGDFTWPHVQGRVMAWMPLGQVAGLVRLIYNSNMFQIIR